MAKSRNLANTSAIGTTSNVIVVPTGTTAQRTSATAGFIRYNTDYGTLESANGTAWANVGSASSITGNIISSQITSVANTQIDGLITSAQLTPNISLSGTLSTAAKGITAASLPTGSVLQVKWTNWTGAYSATSATNVDFTGFNATFTPLYATSKVLIIVSAGINFICDGVVYIKRNGTIVKDSWFGSSRQDDQYDYPQATQTYLDSPATTSTITYQMGGRAAGCASTIRFGASDNTSSILFMEIAA